jgi:hypothetical protein
MIFLKAFAIWVIFIASESVNGILRELWLVPALGNLRAHQLSFAIGSMLILAIATLSITWLQPSRIFQLIQVGSLWMALTLGFELCLGRFVLGYSWNRIAVDYNPFEGGLMGFGLVLLLLAPLIAAKLRGVLPGNDQTA